jgi:hypothetical protein
VRPPLLGALGAALALAALAGPSSARAAPNAGEGIFRLGVTGSGAPLEARREDGADAVGAAAACASCHRRSGLGGREGRVAVPPITARYLFRAAGGADDRDLPWVEGERGEREPYTDALLARAIREGVDAGGRPLGALMPRYPLDEGDMAALIGYLRSLDRTRVPGVTGSTLHFATVVTPDADPVKRAGMLDVMRQFFADRNLRQMEPVPPMRASGRTGAARSMFMVHRRWELHVWELTGPPSTWEAQLERRLAAEPVFAVVSGLGGATWAPVHAFCERAALPCLFPNVEAPPEAADRDFYSMYFTRGVRLEADLVARALLEGGGAPPARVVQVYRAGDSGAAAAAALAAELRARGVAVHDEVLPAEAPATAAARAVAAAGADALVLWLRRPDVAALPDAPPAGAVYLSGLLAGLERAPLPPAWRPRAHLAYPFDLPDRRRVRVDYALGWFRGRRIPVVAEQVQVDTYLALGLLSETLKHMADSFVRDFLVERMEENLAHRILTGYYPRLALASQQRFASKGGYVVHLADGRAGPGLVVDQGWLTP